MSFSSDIKQEISQLEFTEGKARALLSALFLSRASLNWSNGRTWLSFQTQNASIAKLVFRVLKTEYDVDVQIATIKRMNLKKNNTYRLIVQSKANDILEDLGILRQGGLYNTPPYTIVRSEKNARAFMQGLFLASGSINSPKTTNYHMELNVPSQDLAIMAVKILDRFYIPAKITLRKQQYIVYTKAGDKIADFLRLLGANQSLFLFEDARIQRDFYNQLTRLDNCEVANEMKTQKAAKDQLYWIAVIEQSHQKVSDKIAHVMAARKKNPEASNVELCDEIYLMYGETITKSGMKHRMTKIKELAQTFLEANPDFVLEPTNVALQQEASDIQEDVDLDGELELDLETDFDSSISFTDGISLSQTNGNPDLLGASFASEREKDEKNSQ
ncbi:DNA-binding protein WhiA [Allobaculum stercoricanis]|uniref:DNA-binding protein WhiA n=1 Tax=Allobaculum stercoricanis TaxID=174709 RepID=UPI0023F4BF3C|nr:DNA-binding protein WhiA [Allobaculum stercoricanis]